MPNYAITNGSTSGGGTQQPTTTTYVGALLGITSSGATPNIRRFKVYDLLIGTNAAAVDGVMEYDISRVTVGSTATFLAPTAIDAGDPASLLAATVNSSTFGTITTGSNVFYVGVNSRASYRWVAAPGGELVATAASSLGFQLRCRAVAYTGTATGTMHWVE